MSWEGNSQKQKSDPTAIFTTLESKEEDICKFYVVQECGAMDLKAQSSGRVGRVNYLQYWLS